MKNIFIATCFLFMFLISCKKDDEKLSINENELIGQWACISGYPQNYIIDIRNINGTPSPEIVILKNNILYWEPAPLQKHTFVIRKMEGDILVMDEGNNNDLWFKKMKDY